MLAIAWDAGIALRDMWSAIVFVGMGGAFTMAVTIEPSMWGAVAMGCVMGPLCAYYPDHAPEIIGCGFFVNGVYMAWVLRPRTDRPDDGWVDPATR